MKNITPFFEINGQRYEIKATRYLMLQYQKIGETVSLSEEDKFNSLKLQNMATETKELLEKLKVLKEDYYADMTDKTKKALYKACKEAYDEAFEEMARFEIDCDSTKKLQKASIDALEKIAIWGLAEQYFDNDYKKGEEIWCAFVDDVGTTTATEWLMAMSECLFTTEKDGDEHPFLKQMRAKSKKNSQN